MSKQPLRVFSTAFKESLVLRIEAGETLGAIAKESGVRRKLLYEWRAAWRSSGIAGLNRKRGPKPGSKWRSPSPPAASSALDVACGDGDRANTSPQAQLAQSQLTQSQLAQSQLAQSQLAQSQLAQSLAQSLARIGELERVIGRQQVDLNFFQQALRLADVTETQVSIAPVSTRSSQQ